MITAIHLENFQAHEDTLLELHPGVNVIAGSSNSGKSSLLRAINWVVYNRPSGEAFVSHWARDAKKNQKSDTAVTIAFDNATITRRKSKVTKNTYDINGLTLEAVGLDVPEEVSSAINFSEVNTQKQHDAPFLLSESSGEVARFFNKIVNFDAIDKYLSSIESKKRKAKATIDNTKDTIESLEKRLDAYSWLDDAHEKLRILGNNEAVADAYHERVETIEKSLGVWGMHNDILFRLGDAPEKAKELVDKITALLERSKGLTKSITDRSASLVTYNAIQRDISLSVDLGYSNKLTKRIDKLYPTATSSRTTVEAMQRQCILHKQLTAEIASTSIELSEAKSKLPASCPLCGREF